MNQRDRASSPLDIDPFDPYVRARDWGDPGAAPYCPTRPWWRKLGNRWWRIGTRYTVTFPGDLRAIVWQSGLPDSAERRANVIALTIEVAQTDLEEGSGPSTRRAGLEALGAVSLATARVLAKVDAAIAIEAPPILVGQVWAWRMFMPGPSYPFKVMLVQNSGDKPPHGGGPLLLDGPFAPWAPPDYAVEDAVLRRAFGLTPAPQLTLVEPA